MFILFLDDNDDRHEQAERGLNNSGHILLHAYNQQDVLLALKACQEKIGLAMFDHDLDNGEPTGSDIATVWLNEETDKYPARVIVHSNNYAGAQNIISKFQSADVYAEYKPYGIGASYWKDLVASLKEE